MPSPSFSSTRSGPRLGTNQCSHDPSARFDRECRDLGSWRGSRVRRVSGWYLEADPRAVVDASLQVVRDVGCHQLSPLPPTFAEAASLRSVRDALTAREIESASGSTEDDWVASSAAKAVIEMIEYRSAPDHIASRRRLAKLAGKASADWEELEPLLQSSTDPSVAGLAKFTGGKCSKALLEADRKSV